MSERLAGKPRVGSILDVVFLSMIALPWAASLLRDDAGHGPAIRAFAAVAVAVAAFLLGRNFIRFWAEPARWAGAWSIGPYAVLSALLGVGSVATFVDRSGADWVAGVVLLVCAVQLSALAIRDVARVRRRRRAASMS